MLISDRKCGDSRSHLCSSEENTCLSSPFLDITYFKGRGLENNKKPPTHTKPKMFS